MNAVRLEWHRSLPVLLLAVLFGLACMEEPALAPQVVKPWDKAESEASGQNRSSGAPSSVDPGPKPSLDGKVPELFRAEMEALIDGRCYLDVLTGGHLCMGEHVFSPLWVGRDGVLQRTVTGLNGVKVLSSVVGKGVQFGKEDGIARWHQGKGVSLQCSAQAHVLNELNVKERYDLLRRVEFVAPEVTTVPRGVWRVGPDGETLVIVMKPRPTIKMTPTVWRGSPPELQKIEVMDVGFYRDGGTMRFKLAGGDELVVPANMMGMTRSATPRPAVDKVMPDGSIVKVGEDMVLHMPSRGWQWTTWTPKGRKAQRLYVVQADDPVKGTITTPELPNPTPAWPDVCQLLGR